MIKTRTTDFLGLSSFVRLLADTIIHGFRLSTRRSVVDKSWRRFSLRAPACTTCARVILYVRVRLIVRNKSRRYARLCIFRYTHIQLGKTINDYCTFVFARVRRLHVHNTACVRAVFSFPPPLPASFLRDTCVSSYSCSRSYRLCMRIRIYINISSRRDRMTCILLLCLYNIKWTRQQSLRGPSLRANAGARDWW